MAEDILETSGEDIGRVKNVAVAQELAEIEATQGSNKRVDREAELQRINETGLTDHQREMISFNEGLVAKYPHAFTREIGNDGKVYYEIKKPLSEEFIKEWSASRGILTDDFILIVMSTDQDDNNRNEFYKYMSKMNISDFIQLIEERTNRVGLLKRGLPDGVEEYDNMPIRFGSSYWNLDADIIKINPLVSTETYGLPHILPKIEEDYKNFDVSTLVPATVDKALSKF